MTTCLVTGASGYIGGRLAPRLIDAGYRVRCVSRSATALRDTPWAAQAELAQADLLDPASIPPTLADVDVAYYLVHSLGSPTFEQRDRQAAHNFADAARAAGTRRIVYLGGPAPTDPRASAHLRSRQEVAAILSSAGVPTVTLRAPVIIGSGSASFEMLRHLTERLPVMVTPRWVRNRIQPIAVRDVLGYLVAWASVTDEVHRSFDIGGPDVLTYHDMMVRYARIADLPHRVIVPVRALTPRLSALWVGLVTPVPGAIARPLVASLVHEAVAHEHEIAEYVPDPPSGLIGFDSAVRMALAKVAYSDVETRWTTAAWTRSPAQPLPTDPDWAGGSEYVDQRDRLVAAPVDALWAVIEGIGGDTGWHSWPLAWSVRGWVDRLVGGVGRHRGRRDPARLRVGDVVDFWRVEEIEPGRLLRLRAEMLLPGRAWLELRATAYGFGSRYQQRAIFVPKGLAGHLYWKAMSPAHAIIFGGMAENIARAAASGNVRGGTERELMPH
jgi:uncharacterized protein YbjT (DUF2867 family)